MDGSRPDGLLHPGIAPAPARGLVAARDVAKEAAKLAHAADVQLRGVDARQKFLDDLTAIALAAWIAGGRAARRDVNAV
ncbi:MAG: hypothetical protein P4L33_03015 [Capsulimonadaceae bacterium]|nr:hypothetical protein [Capsulimonadaceae bacterium]